MKEKFSLTKFISLSRKRFVSDKDYVNFQKYQASIVVNDIDYYFKLKKNIFAIDFGCGSGGYSEVLAEKYDEVLAVDFEIKSKSHDNIIFENHNLLDFVSKKKADLVFCSSVIEHVNNQQKLIDNIKKSLKEKGKLYISFPPFYSIPGGHQLKPFHYLPEKLAITIGKKLGRIHKSVTGYENMWVTWGLYKTSIKKIKSLLIKNGFKIIEYKPRFVNSKLLNTAKYYLINDLLTWHVEFYCERR